MIQFGSARILWIVNFFKKYRTAGHLVFWKAWPATDHKDKGIYFYTYLMFFSLRGKPFDLPCIPAFSGAFDGKTDCNWGASFVVEIWVSTVVTNSINSKVLMVHGCYCLYCSEENLTLAGYPWLTYTIRLYNLYSRDLSIWGVFSLQLQTDPSKTDCKRINDSGSLRASPIWASEASLASVASLAQIKRACPNREHARRLRQRNPEIGVTLRSLPEGA